MTVYTVPGRPGARRGIFPYIRKSERDALPVAAVRGYNLPGKGVEPMQDTRRKIDVLLDKITSPDLLRRIYRFVQYIYICVQQ